MIQGLFSNKQIHATTTFVLLLMLNNVTQTGLWKGNDKMVNQEKASGTDKTRRNARLPNRSLSETLSLGITYIRARYKE